MEELINLQVHGHANTCKKTGQKVFRFNFPLPPMGQCVILTPNEESDTFDNKTQKHTKENAEEIKEQLDSMKFDEDIKFQQFLKKLGMNEERYIQGLRRTIKHLPSEIRINKYNRQLLKAWRANKDMQYVLDSNACATYILSYIPKRAERHEQASGKS